MYRKIGVLIFIFVLTAINISNAIVVNSYEHSTFKKKSELDVEQELMVLSKNIKISSYLNIVAVTEDIRDLLIKTAEAQLGKPYKWGAVGPKSFDCSGFVNYVFSQNGYKLPCGRCTTKTYGSATEEIEREKLKKGDIILMPGHVVMYAGNGYIIHASGSRGKVIKEKLTSLEKRVKELKYYRITVLEKGE